MGLRTEISFRFADRLLFEDEDDDVVDISSSNKWSSGPPEMKTINFFVWSDYKVKGCMRKGVKSNIEVNKKLG